MLIIMRTKWRTGGLPRAISGSARLPVMSGTGPAISSTQPQAAQLIVQGPQADAQSVGREVAITAAFAQDVSDHPALAGGHRLRQPSGGGVRFDALGPEIEGGDCIRQV